MSEKSEISAFVDQRIADLLEQPEDWGPPEAIELQLLMLIEMLHLSAGSPLRTRNEVNSRYRRYLNRVTAVSPLADRSTEVFINILRGFLAEERNLMDASYIIEFPWLQDFYLAVAETRRDDAVDIILDHLDTLMLDGKEAEVNRLLLHLNPEKMNTTSILAVLWCRSRRSAGTSKFPPPYNNVSRSTRLAVTYPSSLE